jgi:hypothetical protein
MRSLQRFSCKPAPSGGVGRSLSSAASGSWLAVQAGKILTVTILVAAVAAPLGAQGTNLPAQSIPPRVKQAQRFLSSRGWAQGRRGRPTRAVPIIVRGAAVRANAARPQAQLAATTATWQPLGPTVVLTPNYGLVTGRVSALALDPSDATGNRLYLGTTGGGVWLANNAAASGTSSITFTPLTDNAGVLSGAVDASISIGALTVQPGGTGVILAGTGDPNDALDSYYGAGILRSSDGGNSWSLISKTADNLWGFAGEGFAGFAWSTVNPQLVVYFTTEIAACASAGSTCWSAFGAGLPDAPVVQLSASSTASPTHVLVAATYGRGIWATPLWTAATGLTTAASSPVSLAFAGQVFGTASGAQTVTLTNTGSVALTPTAITMSGDFSETDDCANATVAVGTSCLIQIAFTPTATGSRTGEMTIYANISGGQTIVDLSGTGIAAGKVSLTPASMDFGQVQVGSTSVPLQVQAGNSAQAAIPITSIAITAPFTIATNACGTSALPAAADCALTVEFVPTQAGAVSGTLTFTDGAGTQTVTLTGTGAAAATDVLNPLSLTFAGTAMGQLSTALTATLTNTGGEPLTSISISVSGAFQTSSTCGTQLAGPATCVISVVYAPTALGPQTGTLTVSDALRTQTVALNGTGELPAAISVNPSSLTFAVQEVGVVSSPLTLTVTNTGGAPMANVGFQITGQAAASFSTGTTTCPTSNGATLASGAICAVQMIFTPTAAGGNAATLTVSSASLGVTPVNVALSGTGQVESGLNVNPPQLTFAVTSVGQSSAAQAVTVSNTSSFSIIAPAFVVPAQFSVTQNTCTGGLPAVASCTAGVIFQPTAAGPATGVLTISSASVATPATMLLSGTGGAGAAIQITPATLVFATTAPGATSSQTTVTVTNTGLSASLSNLVLAVTAGFALVNNTCPLSLAAGQSCTAGVEFAPAVAGAQTGTLTVTSSAVTTSVSVPLSGISLDFTLSVSGSASQTIAAGQTASYTLAIAPSNGLGGTFTFACGTLPANALCMFNPATETLNGATGNVTVEISTGAASARSIEPRLWRTLPLACGLILLPLGWKRRRKALMLMALLSILAGGISSCVSSGGGTGGGTGGQSGSGSTLPGTYSIPVTAILSGVQHNVTLTLVVD